MKYKEMDLKEITEPQIFDPPKKMVVWDSQCSKIEERTVSAIVKDAKNDTWAIAHPCFIGDILEYWAHCAEIPEEPKPRMATYRELAKWLAQGNGDALVLMQMTNGLSREVVTTSSHYFSGKDNEAVSYGYNGQHCKGVRKWDDTEWHEPTADYIGLEG